MPRVPPVRKMDRAKLARPGANAVTRLAPVGWNNDEPKADMTRKRANTGAEGANPMAETQTPQTARPRAVSATRFFRSAK